MTSIIAAPVETPAHVTPASSIPPIRFARLVGVEWHKATDTRAARWLVGIVALAMTGIMLVPILTSDSTGYSDFIGPPALVMTTLLPVVAILTLTTEWSRRTVLTTFTQEPRRGRVLGAKVAVAMLLTLAGAVLSWLLTLAGIGIASLAGRGIGNDLDGLQVLGVLAFMTLIMLKAVALGALLANSAAAIVLFFVLPTVSAIVGGAVPAIQHWLDTTTTFGWIFDAEWSGHAAQIVVSTLVWVVVPLIAGIAITLRREVK